MLARQPLTPVAAEDVPRIASTVIAGVRRTLIDEGLWQRVRARAIMREPSSRAWIDAPMAGAWCPIEWHLTVMDAIGAELGEDGTRSFGAARLRDNFRGGVLAPILRSWLRSYGGAPGHLMRVAPHVWRAVTRELGRLSVTDTREREVRFRLDGVPERVCTTSAWHRFLEGYGEALLEAGSYRGSVRIVVPDPGAHLEAVASW